ncbi:MAG: hypothetical protein AAF721_28685 [Myxococcota bacterium]
MATAAAVALLAALAWASGQTLEPAPPLEPLEFSPGMLVALGNDADAVPGGDDAAVVPPTVTPPLDDAPQDLSDSPDSDALDDGAPDTITDDSDPPAAAPKPAGGGRRSTTSKPSPPLPRPPKPGPSGGSGGKPTGSPAGFSDRLRDGDAWATNVLAALSKAPVGTYRGALPTGTFRFSLSVCADGSIKRVQRRAKSTIDRDGADRVVHAIEGVRLPRPPAPVRAAMGGGCRKLDHVFAWTATGVE